MTIYSCLPSSGPTFHSNLQDWGNEYVFPFIEIGQSPYTVSMPLDDVGGGFQSLAEASGSFRSYGTRPFPMSAGLITMTFDFGRASLAHCGPVTSIGQPPAGYESSIAGLQLALIDFTEYVIQGGLLKIRNNVIGKHPRTGTTIGQAWAYASVEGTADRTDASNVLSTFTVAMKFSEDPAWRIDADNTTLPLAALL